MSIFNRKNKRTERVEDRSLEDMYRDQIKEALYGKKAKVRKISRIDEIVGTYDPPKSI